MDCTKTGNLIRELRLKQNMTQLQTGMSGCFPAHRAGSCIKGQRRADFERVTRSAWSGKMERNCKYEKSKLLYLSGLWKFKYLYRSGTDQLLRQQAGSVHGTKSITITEAVCRGDRRRMVCHQRASYE